MRAVVQRAASAAVSVNGGAPRSMGRGLVVFLGVTKGDGPEEVRRMAEKVAGLRIFSDENGKMNLSVGQVGGGVMVISNFTLGTDCKKGKRPSFDLAAPPGEAEPLYQRFVEAVREAGLPVETGEFGAEMRVMVENDGPVTIILDTERLAG